MSLLYRILLLVFSLINFMSFQSYSTYYTSKKQDVLTDHVIRVISGVSVTYCQLLCNKEPMCKKIGMKNSAECLLIGSNDNQTRSPSMEKNIIVWERQSCCVSGESDCSTHAYRCCGTVNFGKFCNRDGAMSIKFKRKTKESPSLYKQFDDYIFNEFAVGMWLKVMNLKDISTVLSISFPDQKKCGDVNVQLDDSGHMLLSVRGQQATTNLRPNAQLHNQTWYHILLKFVITDTVKAEGKIEVLLNGMSAGEFNLSDIIVPNSTSIQITLGNEASNLQNGRCIATQATKGFTGQITQIYVWKNVTNVIKACRNVHWEFSLIAIADFHKIFKNLVKSNDDIILDEYPLEINVLKDSHCKQGVL